MHRSRKILLALLVALLGLAGRTHANAAVCFPCICAEQCESTDQKCVSACHGNITCEGACAVAYNRCEASCD
jgi:hypothetical protein